MRIILGTSTKVRNVDGGAFFCPACKSETHYSRLRVSRYFTFFFIPLFPIRTLGEYIRCARCQAELRPEVAKLKRQQIEQAMAPWTCPGCGNRNAPEAMDCLSCGTTREPGPPPLPGQSAPVPAAFIMSAPPLAVLKTGVSKGFFGTIILILGSVALFVVVLSLALIIWGAFHAKKRPEIAAEKQARVGFETASKSIADSGQGVAHGNTARAQELAASLSEALGDATQKVYAGAESDLKDKTNGKFLVFCQLTENSCVFLVHVPGLRRFDSKTQHSLATLCYAEAVLQLKTSGDTDIRRLAVAIRGDLFYDTALIGNYPPQNPDPMDHLENLAIEAWDVPGLYPFFATRAENEKVAPTTPIPLATPPAPSNPSNPSRSIPLTRSAPAARPADETPTAPRPILERQDAPSWIPIYPVLERPAHNVGRRENGMIKGRINFETADPFESVKEFYESKLKESNFEITRDETKARLFETAEIESKRTEDNRMIHVSIRGLKKRTVVNLTYEGGEKP